MSAELDRPMTLKRPPKPAADDRVDPIEVAPPAAAPASTTQGTTPAPRGKKRELTVPLSNRISVEASEVLERAAEEAGSIRAALEQAIFAHWGRP
jgi:hypothetical protein